MFDGLEIRAPQDAEKERIFGIYQSGLPNVDMISHDDFLSLWARCKHDGTLQSFWRVAVIDCEPVGIVINSISESLKWGCIWELAVAPEWRNKGIGESLVRESQQLLLAKNPHITHFALGVKTHNQRALSLYERLGYGIRFLVLQLRGQAGFAKDGDYNLKPAAICHIPSLKQLEPDVYYNSKDQTGWTRAIQGEDAYIVGKNDTDDIIGFLKFSPDFEFKDSTAVDYAYASENSLDVIRSALNQVKTSSISFWVQDNHQEILEYLYEHSFQRVDSEYHLLRKTDLYSHR